MDSLDYQILSILKKNARIKASDISKEIHLSVSTVIERIRKLENSGIIESYTIITDEHKMGNDLTALMEISLTHPRFNDSFIEKIMEHPNIISCYYLTGDFDYLVKICCRSSEHLEQIPLFPNPLLKIMLDFRSEIHKLMELRKNALTKHFCAFPMNPFHTISLLRIP